MPPSHQQLVPSVPVFTPLLLTSAPPPLLNLFTKPTTHTHSSVEIESQSKSHREVLWCAGTQSVCRWGLGETLGSPSPSLSVVKEAAGTGQMGGIISASTLTGRGIQEAYSSCRHNKSHDTCLTCYCRRMSGDTESNFQVERGPTEPDRRHVHASSTSAAAHTHTLTS